MIWDAHKLVLRGRLISLMSGIKKERKQERHRLITNIKILQKSHNSTTSKKVYQRYLRKRRWLELLDAEKIQRKLLYLTQNMDCLT